MTHAEYTLQHSIILLSYDLGDIPEQEYYAQLEALTEKFGEEFEEEL